MLVAILQALRMLAEIARSEDDGGIGYCIAECILGCLASIMEYFNKVRFVVCSVRVYVKCYVKKKQQQQQQPRKRDTVWSHSLLTIFFG